MVGFPAWIQDRRGATHAVCLANGTLFVVQFEGHGWRCEKVGTDADTSDTVEVAIARAHDDP